MCSRAADEIEESPQLRCWIVNSAGETAKENGPFGFINPETFMSFVAGQPQPAWLAITGKQTPAPTMSSQAPLAAGTGCNSLYAGFSSPASSRTGR
jgi:hypothetical protein